MKYEKNNLKLYNQDCFETLRSLKDNSVDLILTDPPYNVLKEDYDNICFNFLCLFIFSFVKRIN